MQSNHAMTDNELAEIRTMRQEHLEMKADSDRIALFLREHYAREISLGQHQGMKTTADAAILYMGRERELSRLVEKLNEKIARLESRIDRLTPKD